MDGTGMKIRVNTATCQGHARCWAEAPDVYRLDDEGYCISDGATVPAGFEEQARLGANVCPDYAITLED
jgi:ferredoxin